jgi:hypothetical protein
METLRGIKQPTEFGFAEGEDDGKVAAWDRIGKAFGDPIKTDIIDTKSPDVILNVEDVFLMGFWS